MQTLYDFLRRYKTEDGSELCEPFIRAPKRRTDPAYFEVVSDPIDMLRIQQKLKTDEYADLPELRDDFQKLVNNALKYYKEDQEERQAALEMKDLLDKAMGETSRHTTYESELDIELCDLECPQILAKMGLRLHKQKNLDSERQSYDLDSTIRDPFVPKVSLTRRPEAQLKCF